MNAGLTRLLMEGRRMAESIMTDTCRIERTVASGALDPDTCLPATRPETVWQGKCRIQTSGGIASATSMQGQSSPASPTPTWSLYLQLPITATGLQSGDSAVITASLDPDLVGRRYRLVNQQSEKSHATARRWNVEETPQEA